MPVSRRAGNEESSLENVKCYKKSLSIFNITWERSVFPCSRVIDRIEEVVLFSRKNEINLFNMHFNPRRTKHVDNPG